MFNKILGWIRSVINKMFNVNVGTKFNVNVAMSDKMVTAISLWEKMYKDEAPWLNENVISQCANFLIFKINHPADLEYIAKSVPNMSEDVVEKQKTLQSGTCVAFGKMMKIPLIVKMQLPNPEPQSTNAKIFDKWMIQWKSN